MKVELTSLYSERIFKEKGYFFFKNGTPLQKESLKTKSTPKYICKVHPESLMPSVELCLPYFTFSIE